MSISDTVIDIRIKKHKAIHHEKFVFYYLKSFTRTMEISVIVFFSLTSN